MDQMRRIVAIENVLSMNFNARLGDVFHLIGFVTKKQVEE